MNQRSVLWGSTFLGGAQSYSDLHTRITVVQPLWGLLSLTPPPNTPACLIHTLSPCTSPSLFQKSWIHPYWCILNQLNLLGGQQVVNPLQPFWGGSCRVCGCCFKLALDTSQQLCSTLRACLVACIIKLTWTMLLINLMCLRQDTLWLRKILHQNCFLYLIPVDSSCPHRKCK